MNKVKLTTESGHTWQTAIATGYEDAKAYFLGKVFQIGSFGETKPNEGFTPERVVKMEFTEVQTHQDLEIPIKTTAFS